MQASEKASGSVAQAVKAIAEDRQWRHGSHHLRRTIVNLISGEFGQPNLAELHAISDRLHDNFYEDRLHDWELREYLDRIAGLLEDLWEIREQGPSPEFVPTPEQQRTIDRLRLSEVAAADPLVDFPPPMPPFVPPEN